MVHETTPVHVVAIPTILIVIALTAGCFGANSPEPANVLINVTDDPPPDATIVNYNRSGIDSQLLKQGFQRVGADGRALLTTSDEEWQLVKEQLFSIPNVENKTWGYYIKYNNTIYHVGLTRHG